ncbi:MAG: kynureninase [Chloroflexota bacterium]
MNTRISLDRNYARQLDQQDPLAFYREQFVIDDPDTIYMDGNSLGRLPLAVVERTREVVTREWGKNLISSWNQGWWESPIRIGEKVAKLIGASPGQVIVCDSVSIDLFKLTMAVLSRQTGRAKIITDTLNFPSDLYVLQGCVNLLGNKHKIVRIGSQDGDITPDLDGLNAAIDQDTALVTLSHVTYKSGYLYDMAAITEKAHQVGALVIWDLCHSVGALPIDLDGCKVDFALGCSYKYLNGGPGSPAFIYASHKMQEIAMSPIWGWWSQNTPFAFDLDYTPAAGMKKFLTGSQSILSMLGLEAALAPHLQAGMQPLRDKSIQMSEYIIQLSDSILAPLGFKLGSPRDPNRRGSHISLRHPEGYRINRVLIDELNVIPDFREPDNIRFGLAPLYTTFCDVWEAIERSRQAVADRLFEKIPPTRLTVT